MQIHPQTLHELRRARKLSQQDLAELARVSKRTVARIEAQRQSGVPVPSNQRTAPALARALKVDVEVLASEPGADRDTALQSAGYQRVAAVLSPETALAYRMVEHKYGVPREWIFEMAPLFFGLLAEGSLDWRRQMLDELSAAAEQFETLERRAGHLAFAYPLVTVETGLAEEQHSLEAKDLFGDRVGVEPMSVGFDRSRYNPFADYLRQLAAAIGDRDAIEIEAGRELWNMGGRAPGYRIAGADLDAITGKDMWAERALLSGLVNIADIPAHLRGDDARVERISWLAGHVPEEDRRRYDLLFDIDLGDLLGDEEAGDG